jgi:hypothetical protein
MEAVKVIGFDIAKSVFQVHGIDVEGKVIIRRQLKCHYVLGSSRSSRRALSALRPVAQLILITRTPRAWTHCPPDACSPCEAIRRAT